MNLSEVAKGLCHSRSDCNYSLDLNNPPLRLVNSHQFTDSININLGLSLIDKCALVILAGGCATRLGLGIPKLLLEIDGKTNILTLFLSRVLSIRSQAGLTNDSKTRVFILTSSYTSTSIIEFINSLDTFYTSSLSIEVILQPEIKCLDLSFNPLNLLSPNGNGGLYEALENCPQFWNSDFDFLHIIGSDNILSNPLDPSALAALYSESSIDALLKCIETDSNNMGIIAIRLDKMGKIPCIVEYSEMVTEVANQKIKYGNLCDHMFRAKFVKDFIATEKYKKMPWHLAKRTAIDNEKTIPVYKLEKFIFDIIGHSNNVMAYAIPANDFAPIKTIDDLDKNDPKSSINKYLSKL